MNVDKAWETLSRLVEDSSDDLLKFAKASAILDGIERGVPSHPVAEQTRRIIFDTRQWFEELCGLGDYDSGDAQIRQQLRAYLERLRAPNKL
jgi:hypothetical protein